MILLIYALSFVSVAAFSYVTVLVFRGLGQLPVAEAPLFAESRVLQNPLFKFMMLVTRVLGRLNLNLNLGAYELALKRNLDAAGRPWDLKPEDYLGLKELCALLAVGVGLLLHLTLPEGRLPLLTALLLVVPGFFVPDLIVNSRIRARRFSVLRDLPFMCDLLTLAVDAGLDFGTSLERVAENGPHGPLRNELFVMLQETRIGKSRREALQTFGERMQMPEVSSFVGAMVQADRMGTGFASVLRIQSEQIRRQRFERAEKLAQKSPVKILFPIIVANLISIGIILVVPLLTTIGDLW